MSAKTTRLYHRLQIAAHRMQKAADRAVMTAAGVSTAQAAVLAIVARGAPIAQRAVADELGINESAVTAMSARLLKMGLLERERAADDARVWRLSLSAEGSAAMHKVEAAFTRINARIDDTLSEDEVSVLAERLVRLAGVFDDR